MVLRSAVMVCMLVSFNAYADNNTIWYNPYPQRMSTEDLNTFKYDCGHIREQRKFLQAQLASISRYEINSLDRAIILELLNQMPNDCLPPEPVAESSCSHVREDMNSGTANSTVCYSREDPNTPQPTGAPIIDRWEPIVDRK